MKIVSCLSLQAPWLSRIEFEILSLALQSGCPISSLNELDGLALQTKEMLQINSGLAFQQASELEKLCCDLGFEILYPGHPNYAEGFLELEEPPLFLTLQGKWSKHPSIAIVGSREPSRFAVDWLNENLKVLLSSQNCLVVSGGARGIDMTAHLNAVRSSQPTLVFLPSGLTNIYPRDLEKWKSEILEAGGGFVSEFHPKTEMRKHHFVKRNRLIVAASDLVFVVEARRKSGSMLTANIAGDLYKNVCTLPACPSMTCAEGSLDLLFNNAFPIREAADLLSLLNLSSRRVLKLRELQC